MGELIVETDGIQKAFEECDKLIAGSIRGVAALVTRPGLIKIGLDDLLTALRNSDSRCLFGSGRASGENRAKEALRLAINSPLLAKGKMFSSASNILVHITGGEDLRLHEIEGLMRELGKSVPEDAQLLFGAAIDPSLKKELCVTLFSSLSHDVGKSEDAQLTVAEIVPPVEAAQPEPESAPEPEPEPVEDKIDEMDSMEPEYNLEPDSERESSLFDEPFSAAYEDEAPAETEHKEEDISVIENSSSMEETVSYDDERELEELPEVEAPPQEDEAFPESNIPEPKKSWSQEDPVPIAKPRSMFRPDKRDDDRKPIFVNDPTVRIPLRPEVTRDAPQGDRNSDENRRPTTRQSVDESGESEKPIKKGQPQLELEKSSEGRFAKSEPTIVDGVDLDTPAYLRKRRRRP